MAQHRIARDRPLTATGLTRLLARLDPDPDRAASEYERLRRALFRFFDWRGAWPPEDCVDDTLDRLAAKLEGTVVEDVWSYAHGIARLILFERRRQPGFTSLDDDRGHPGPALATRAVDGADADAEDANERLLACLDRCLATLDGESRSVLLGYYEGERSVKIRNRRRLAASLGLSENALRSRVHRLRDRLEHCIGACAAEEP